MDADRYIAGTVADSIIDGFEAEIRTGDGRSDPLIGVAVVTYLATYRTSPAAPTDLDDFTSANVTHQLVGGVPDTAPAIDTFTVEVLREFDLLIRTR